MEESKLNIGCIRFLKMNKDSMSCAHSNESRVVERLASRASKIESARCSSFRGVRNLTERKEFYPNHLLLESTVIQLIQRLYDIIALNVDWLRSPTSVVSEEHVLFAGSIEENIRLSKPNATDEEVIAVAKMVYLPDVRLFYPHHRLFRCHLE